jgi:hypothetical protein
MRFFAAIRLFDDTNYCMLGINLLNAYLMYPNNLSFDIRVFILIGLVYKWYHLRAAQGYRHHPPVAQW